MCHPWISRHSHKQKVSMYRFRGSHSSSEDWRHDCVGLSLLCPRHLIRETPAWISGCWQADSVWCVALRLDMQSPQLPGEHYALCWWGRQSNGSHFQQKQEVRIGGFLLPGPFFPPSPTRSQTETMCVLTPWTSAYSRPGCSVGKWCGLPNNMWFQETFSPSFSSLLFESLLCITPQGSLGEVVSDSSMCPDSRDIPPPSSSFQSRLSTRWMWLGKYSSLSPGPQVISCCHGLTSSRLRKMA